MRNRSDDNQAEIVSVLREIGCSVQILSQVGFGCPDLLVGFRGKNYLFEVKQKGGKLRESQKEWFSCWNGQVSVVRSIMDAFSVLEIDK